MKRKLNFIAICLSLAVFTTVATLAPVTAAPAPAPSASGQALEIAPPVLTLSGNPGQTVKAQIYLRDISSGPLVVTGEVNDFVAKGEDGTPKLLLKDEGNNPYSLKNFVAPLPKLNLVPKEIKTMTVTFNVPANASPGGHYGVLRFTGTAPDLQSTGVSLSASIGALVLFTVNGDTKEDLSIKEFSVNNGGKASSIFESGPVNFLERLTNNGNIHEAPVGVITINDMFGKKVANVMVNQPPRNILPQSTRKFQQPLDKATIGNKKLFGRYTAELKVTYGKDKKVVTSTVAFWVIPYKLIGGVIVALIAGFFVVRELLRRYNRRVIERSQKSNHDNRPPQPPQNPQPPQTPPTPPTTPPSAPSE